MSYRNDPEDKQGMWEDFFSAQHLAKVGVYLVIVAIVFIVIRIVITDEDRLQTAIDLSKLELKHIPYNYSFDKGEGVLTVSFWESGRTATSKKAFLGDAEALDTWESTKDSIQKYANTIYANMVLKEVSDIRLIVKLVNEDNKSRNLLIITDGALTYDVVRDTKGE